MQTHLPLASRRQGKVRDVYEATLADGRQVVVMVATDRLSAFDVIMSSGIPGKGILLTQMSQFWFEFLAQQLGTRLRHHLLSTQAEDVPGIEAQQREQIAGRVMIGIKTQVVPIECVVRGYLAGSGWKEYQATGQVAGYELPKGLRLGDELPKPLFTPATKAAAGHDENITYAQACELVGQPLMKELRELSLLIYQEARTYARSKGIIIADTKFEFGLPAQTSGQASGERLLPMLIDEVLTPDSSRFWPMETYAPGREQESFDKQFVRDFLEREVAAGRWNKSAPGPILPDEVIVRTQEKYIQAYQLLTGCAWKPC